MTKKLIAVGALALMLAGCSSISSGYITDKTYTEPWTQQITQCWYGMDYPGMPNYLSKGSPYPCIPSGYRTVDHPASWEFSLKEEDETGWADVSEDTYNSYEVGDYFQNPKDKDN